MSPHPTFTSIPERLTDRPWPGPDTRAVLIGRRAALQLRPRPLLLHLHDLFGRPEHPERTVLLEDSHPAFLRLSREHPEHVQPPGRYQRAFQLAWAEARLYDFGQPAPEEMQFTGPAAALIACTGPRHDGETLGETLGARSEMLGRTQDLRARMAAAVPHEREGDLRDLFRVLDRLGVAYPTARLRSYESRMVVTDGTVALRIDDAAGTLAWAAGPEVYTTGRAGSMLSQVRTRTRTVDLSHAVRLPEQTWPEGGWVDVPPHWTQAQTPTHRLAWQHPHAPALAAPMPPAPGAAPLYFAAHPPTGGWPHLAAGEPDPLEVQARLFQAQLGTLMATHAGRFVAFEDGHILASGETRFATLRRLYRLRPPPTPTLIRRVSHDDPGRDARTGHVTHGEP